MAAGSVTVASVEVGGTRVTLDTVLTATRRGSTPEQIADDDSALQLADIYASIAYYLRHRDDPVLFEPAGRKSGGIVFSSAC